LLIGTISFLGFFIVCLQTGAPAAGLGNPLGCGTVGGPFDAQACLRLLFRGEVSASHTFERKFGGNLVFRLSPQTALSGWTIEVIPEEQQSSEPLEYVWPVNAPYRSYNVRDLGTSYGTSAKDAVAYSPREFNFVLNESQFKRAADLLDILIMSRPQPDKRSKEEIEKEWNNAIAEMGTLQVAKGRLTIRDSRITESEGKDRAGAIEWLKFDVELRVPCGFAATPSAEVSVDTTKCSVPQDGKH
jgi:hypothetical protein